MIALLATPLGRYIALGLAAVLLAGGAYFYIDHKARVDERNAVTARTLEQQNKDRRDREKNDENARKLDDARALECLRNPSGCR